MNMLIIINIFTVPICFRNICVNDSLKFRVSWRIRAHLIRVINAYTNFRFFAIAAATTIIYAIAKETILVKKNYTFAL